MPEKMLIARSMLEKYFENWQKVVNAGKCNVHVLAMAK